MQRLRIMYVGQFGGDQAAEAQEQNGEENERLYLVREYGASGFARSGVIG